MSQVKRYANGTSDGGIQPAVPATASPSQFTFKVNGNDYKLDEQSIRDQFNPIFDSLVQKGEAHARDRDKWLASNEQVIKNMRNGTYNLQSSAGKTYNAQYDGSASNESLGLDDNGDTARKTGIGNFISRGSKSDAQRVAMLDNYLSDHVISSFNSSQNDAKAKALQDSDKNKQLGQDNALSILQKSLTPFGQSKWGKDLDSDEGKKMILDTWFGKENSNSKRYSDLMGNYTDRYKGLYNPALDQYKDYLKTKGFDIDALRGKANEYYDSGTNTFKGKYGAAKDLVQLSNPFDTMVNDSIFADRSAYDKSLAPVKPAGTAADGTPLPTPLKEQNGLWTDGTHFFQDKDKKVLQKGFDKNNLLYGDDGTLFTGWHLHQDNPDHPLTGFYEQGKQGTVAHGNNYMDALSKLPVNDPTLKKLQSQHSQIVSAYDNVLNSKQWLNAGDNENTDDATYNVWAGRQANGTAPAKTYDATANYHGASSKLNVQYLTSNKLNEYGRNQILHMVTLPNNSKYYGKILTDINGNVTGMQDPNGHPITDPTLNSALHGLVYDGKATNPNSKNTIFSPNATHATPTPNAKSIFTSDMGASMFKEGGKVKKHQFGGEFDDNTKGAGSATPKQHEATVGDIGKSISDPAFHISGADKAELAALGLNLGSLATSVFGGGGAGVAAGLGAAGTLTQLGADISKHGTSQLLSDLGSAGLGLGLDAASILPGLGVLSEGSKVAKTLARTSRVLIPALTAMGLVHAGGVVADLVSGRKGWKDLNVDDMRALTQGITAVVGGGRAITQRVGTTPGSVSSIALKDGTQVPLDEAGLNAINSAPDKIAAAKSVVSRLTGKGEDEFDLAQKSAISLKGWDPRQWIGKQPDATVITSKTARVPLNAEDIQGNSLWNNFQRFAANKATMRDFNTPKANIDPKYKVDLGGDVTEASPGATAPSKWSWFGDYGSSANSKITDYNTAKTATGDDLGTAMGARREGSGNFTSSPAQPTYEFEAGKTATVGDVPDTRRIYGSMFGMRSLDNERSLSFQEIRNRAGGLQGTKSSRDQLNKFMQQKFEEGSFAKTIQDQISQAVSDPKSKGYVKFKKGGILKAQTGANIPYALPNSGTMFNNVFGLGANGVVDPTSRPFYSSTSPDNPSNFVMKNAFSIGGNGIVTPTTKVIVPSVPNYTTPTSNGNLSTSGGAPSLNNVGLAAGSNGSGVNLPKFSINPTTVSELGRALYTSQLNNRIDTKVERPMLTAPIEIPISVRGNLYAEATANKQANNLVRDSQGFRTSDGTLQMLGNLESQRNAAGIRMQGAQQNIQTLEQTRQQAQQAAQQNAQNRNNIANENVQTNARATQAERQANNEKRAMVNQPLLDFWKDQNYKSYIQGQQNKAIDTQIGGIGEENLTRNLQQELSQAMYKVWTDPNIPDNERQGRYQQLANQASTLQSKLSKSELTLRKNPYSFQSPGLGYYTQGIDLQGIGKLLTGSGYNTVPVQKDGGTVLLQREALKQGATNSREIAKTHNDNAKEGLQEQTKIQMESMKEINDLIRMALK